MTLFLKYFQTPYPLRYCPIFQHIFIFLILWQTQHGWPSIINSSFSGQLFLNRSPHILNRREFLVVWSHATCFFHGMWTPRSLSENGSPDVRMQDKWPGQWRTAGSSKKASSALSSPYPIPTPMKMCQWVDTEAKRAEKSSQDRKRQPWVALGDISPF